MADTKQVYVIRYHDPRSTEYHFEGREDICWDKGVFVDRDVAEMVKGFMEMFKEVGDPTTFSVRPLDLNEETDFTAYKDRLFARKAG